MADSYGTRMRRIRKEIRKNRDLKRIGKLVIITNK